jgi:hypothetical protein
VAKWENKEEAEGSLTAPELTVEDAWGGSSSGEVGNLLREHPGDPVRLVAKGEAGRRC